VGGEISDLRLGEEEGDICKIDIAKVVVYE
jgi:hypothetical protein